MPVRNTPSNVPAPPIDTIGAPEARDPPEIEEVGPDQGTHGARDVSNRRRPTECREQGDAGGDQRWRDHGHRDADPGTSSARRVHHRRDHARGDQHPH